MQHRTVDGNRVGFKSGFGFEPGGFGLGFGFKKKGGGFGFGLGFETKGRIGIWIGIRGARICTSLVCNDLQANVDGGQCSQTK